jgi:hypothetical protein
VTADAALDEQIKRYRLMTGEQRLAIALELHELSCEIAREGIRRQHPEADAEEVESLLHRRLELARLDPSQSNRNLQTCNDGSTRRSVSDERRQR